LCLGESDSELDVMRLHGICLKLLDMVYLQYNEVYDRLHQLAVAGSPITNKDRYCKWSLFSIIKDRLLLSQFA